MEGKANAELLRVLAALTAGVQHLLYLRQQAGWSIVWPDGPRHLFFLLLEMNNIIIRSGGGMLGQALAQEICLMLERPERHVLQWDRGIVEAVLTNIRDFAVTHQLARPRRVAG